MFIREKKSVVAIAVFCLGLAGCSSSDDDGDESGSSENETVDIATVENGPPTYEHDLRDDEGEAFVTDNVITLIGSSSDENSRRNRLIVDTKDRLIVDLVITEVEIGDEGNLEAGARLNLYNDTVNTDETETNDPTGDVNINVSIDYLPSSSEFAFNACANRVINPEEEESFFIFNSDRCFRGETPVQIGERVRFGADLNRETSILSIIMNDSVFDFELVGPVYPAVQPFNRLEVVAQGANSRITTEVFGIGSDNFDDDFSNGVKVEGLND